MFRKIVLSAAFAVGAVSAAQAATYTFDFTVPRADNQEAQYYTSNEDASFGVTVEGFYYSLLGSSYVQGGAIDVDSNSYGLISQNGWDEHHTIDSWGSDESMKFTFDNGALVTLTNIVISWAEGYGWYDLFGDDSLIGSSRFGTPASSDEYNSFAVGTRTHSIYYHRTCGNRFSGYYNCSYTDYKESGIKIESITVEYTAPPSVVPLPAGAPLLLGGFGALAFLRRRKSA
ncbi:VPLPA-CTERM protein sorting domain-containing protein [Lutimaribacter pacificus]|uniref:VPLPA-CTERM protein sorting domain-containing protein n=1 Tax=Lutimaribacter pacificus TaxID=391948 RepID=A0A1H0EZL6_9RHOB|nr:VPLPA-CTERM sorting domain-containing protein [Lutimaribacter pacificus]SDN87746.1 VPLPA-CTERM protein sorting domain-containing protein [Lutimaribacter pacificus]SHK42876.1 VPLPA-CTERM protein sorting domain-containing protein [Lutimaribacter pacificus]